MKQIPSLLLCALLFLPTAFGDSRTDRVDALFEKWDRTHSPGCALGLIENGDFVYKRGYGMADLERGVPNSSSTVFRIGSVSKQFTAMAVLLAANQGKLSIDDDIRKYLPEMPDYGEPVTMRQMLHHTSGLRDYLVLMMLAGKRDEDYYTDEEVMDKLSHLRNLNFPPGDEYLYSNSGYFLLSQIIFRTTGKTLREWAEEQIFEPLDMDHTHFHDDPRMIVWNRAVGYRPKKEGGFEIDMTTLEMVGDGGIFTTIDDLLEWDRNFDDNRLGGQAIMTQMLTPGKLNGGIEQDYGFGLGITQYRGLNVVEHGGAFVGFRAGMMRFPDQDFSAYCLCNVSAIEPTELLRKIADIYLEDRMSSEVIETVTLPKEVLQRRVGTYWNRRTAGFADIKLEGEELMLVSGDMHYPLLALDEERCLAKRGLSRADVRFEEGEGASGPRMTIQFPGQRVYEYELVKRVEPKRAELEEYEGTYYCDELEATYTLRLGDEGKLIFKVTYFPDQLLEPVFPDGFRWDFGSVVFERDGEGKVTGFELQAGRARNFVFVKKEAK
jgi:CubicO group peptidase (beta-lactamase class C family)